MTPPTDACRAAVAAVTAWLADDAQGRSIAAAAIDSDPIGFLDAMAALWTVVADTIDDAAEQLHPSPHTPSVQQILQAVGLGIAQAELDDAP